MAKAAQAAHVDERKSPPPRPPDAPIGRKLENAFGPGTLNPGVGKRVQRSGHPEYCGAIFGRAFGYMSHPNAKDANKLSYRFAGQFIGIDHLGVTKNTAEVYLPSSLQNSIKAGLDARGTSGGAIDFSAEIWCEPDERESSQLGFRYAVYDRMPTTAADPMLALGYASGLLERPATAAIANTSQEEYVDPETGEVS